MLSDEQIKQIKEAIPQNFIISSLGCPFCSMNMVTKGAISSLKAQKLLTQKERDCFIPQAEFYCPYCRKLFLLMEFLVDKADVILKEIMARQGKDNIMNEK